MYLLAEMFPSSTAGLWISRKPPLKVRKHQTGVQRKPTTHTVKQPTQKLLVQVSKLQSLPAKVSSILYAERRCQLSHLKRRRCHCKEVIILLKVT